MSDATRWWVVLALSVMLALIAVAFLVSGGKWWWAIGPGGMAAFGAYRLVGARRSGRPLGAR